MLKEKLVLLLMLDGFNKDLKDELKYSNKFFNNNEVVFYNSLNLFLLLQL